MKKGKVFGALSAAFVRGIMRLVYMPEEQFLDREALENSDVPLIFVSNHTSCLDPLLLLTTLKDFKPYTLAAKDWYEKKWLTAVMRENRCIPVDRYNLDTSWLRRSVEALGKDGSIIIFPEGHTEKCGETDEFKSGFLMLALMSGAKIVPVWHDGYSAFHMTRIVIGEPMSVSEGVKMTVKTMAPECERFRREVVALGEQYDDAEYAKGKQAND